MVSSQGLGQGWNSGVHVLGEEPNYSWATDEELLPTSMSDQK